MNNRKRLMRVMASPANVRFGDMVTLAQAFGFRLLRTSGSHHIFARHGMPEQLNLQDVRGRAKPY
ncbi:MAG TPA: type II toxin-antitoxin system HicA family toxin [Tepidisphaeraceae bacterium]|nr:type II toxin-antitoxin system HicA family toxin [Tepidisphaeraceae bacterium]